MWKSLKGAALSAVLLLRGSQRAVSRRRRHALRSASVAGEPGVGQAHEGLHRRLHAGAARLRRAVRPPRIRRPAARISARTASSAKSRGCTMRAIRLPRVDPATLEPRERFDREYLLAVVDRDLFWIEKTKFPFSNPAWYIGQHRSGHVLEPQLCAARCAHEGLHQVRARHSQDGERHQGRISSRRCPGPTWNWASRSSAALPISIPRMWPRCSLRSADPDLQKQLTEADTAAAQAMDALKDYLVAERKNANDKFALGADLFAQMLKHTEQVDVAGRSDRGGGARRSRAQYRGAQDRVRRLRTARRRWRNASPRWPPTSRRAEPVEDARDAAARCSRTSSSRTMWSRFRATTKHWSPKRRPTIAPMRRSFKMPGPYDHGVASIYNIAPPDPKWSKAEQAAYIPERGDAAVHLGARGVAGTFPAVPAFERQSLEARSIVGGICLRRRLGALLRGDDVERGSGQGRSEKHIGQLIEALLRDVRLLSSIGLHTHGMTVAQSEKMFREQAFSGSGQCAAAGGARHL